MSIIPQMTPYGVYNLTYARKNNHAASIKKTAAPVAAAKGYDTGAFSLYLRTKIFSGNMDVQKNEYKQQIFDVMAAARSLSDNAEKFTDEDWPKPEVKGTLEGMTVELSDDATKKSYAVDVRQLASNRAYSSNTFNSAERGLLTEGTYSFIIESKNNSQKALFMLGKNSNAHVITEKITDAINSSGSGIAYAVTKHTDDKVLFTVHSTVSGSDGDFRLCDDVGDALATLGVRADGDAQDGMVTIDGREEAMKNNSVFIDSGKVKFTFSQTGKQDITIGNNNEQSVIALRALVNNYNDFKESFVKSHNTTPRVSEMFGVFDGLFKDIFSGQGLGLAIDSDDRLSLDENLFRENLEKNPLLVEKVKDGNSSIAAILHNMANSLKRNPLNTYFATFPIAHNMPDKYNGILVDITA